MDGRMDVQTWRHRESLGMKMRVGAVLPYEALTNQCLCWTRLGSPSQTLAAVCQTQCCPVLEEGERGEGWLPGTPCVTETKNPLISSCFLLILLSPQKIPELSF